LKSATYGPSDRGGFPNAEGIAILVVRHLQYGATVRRKADIHESADNPFALLIAFLPLTSRKGTCSGRRAGESTLGAESLFCHGIAF
jgi:hypothetical protein